MVKYTKINKLPKIDVRKHKDDRYAGTENHVMNIVPLNKTNAYPCKK